MKYFTSYIETPYKNITIWSLIFLRAYDCVCFWFHVGQRNSLTYNDEPSKMCYFKDDRRWAMDNSQ